MNDPKDRIFFVDDDDQSSKVNRLKQDLLSQTENELQLRGLRVLKNEIYAPWQSTTTTEIKKAALKLVKELTDQHLAPASVLATTATTIKQQSFETVDSIEQEKALMNRVRNQNLLAATAAAEEEEGGQRELQLNCATTMRANNKTSSIIIETLMSDFRTKLGMSINEYQVNVFDASLKAHADEKLRQKNAAKVFGYNIVSDDSDNGGHHDDGGEEEDEDEDDNEDDDDGDNNEGILEANLQQSRQMATEAYERSKKMLNEVCQELDSDKITPLKRKLDAINQFHNLMIRVLASNFSAVNDLKGPLNEMMIMNQPHHSHNNKHLHHQYPSPSSLSTSPSSSSRPSSSIITTACHRFHHEIDNMQTRLEILGNKEMNQIGMEAQAFQHTQSLQKATIQAGCTDPSLNNKINLSHAKSDLILRRSVHTKADLLLTQTANKFDELLRKSRSVLQNNDNLISRVENDMSQLRTQDNLEERLTAEEAVKEIRTQVHATLEREINTRFQGAARIQSHTTKQQVSRLGTAGQLQEDLLFKEMSEEFEKKLLTSSPQSAAYPHHHHRHQQQQQQEQQEQQHTQQMDIENEGEERIIRRREERERRRRIERERESITAAGKTGRADGEGKDINQSSTNPTTTKPPKFINPKPLVVGGGNVKPSTTKNLSTIAELIARSKPSGPVVKEPSVKKK